MAVLCPESSVRQEVHPSLWLLLTLLSDLSYCWYHYYFSDGSIFYASFLCTDNQNQDEDSAAL